MNVLIVHSDSEPRALEVKAGIEAQSTHHVRVFNLFPEIDELKVNDLAGWAEFIVYFSKRDMDLFCHMRAYRDIPNVTFGFGCVSKLVNQVCSTGCKSK